MSDDEADVEQPMPSKQGGFARAMKFVGSATAGTKLGRKAILGVLGDDGEAIFNAIKDSAKIVFGETQGKQLKQDMVKLVLKVGIMLNEKLLTPENTSEATEPLQALLVQAHRSLENPDLGADPQFLVAAMNRAFAVANPIVSRHMKPDNVKKLQNVTKQLSDQAFVDAVLNRVDLRPQRVALADTLQRIMAHVEIAPAQAAVSCRATPCVYYALSVAADDAFRPAGLCESHHADRYDAMIDRPDLQSFLADERAAAFLMDYLTEIGEAVHLQCLRAIRDFRNGTSQPSRYRALVSINSKFLAENAPSPVGDAVSAASRQALAARADAIDEDNPRVPVTLFQEVESDLNARLQAVFADRFLRSTALDRFAGAFRLPTRYRKTAQLQRRARRRSSAPAIKTSFP
ncbi:unnamed protein product (mitochondrion) [Plasmodiophora brassicae]|uniref:RGS domain-containing protein n=1 Tax=Plasmodiophora brassicae TaxID=37360 RepID=A0A0G4IIM4_PLABS|nr:hypothetical protein PBRA_003780 [Plasmodiophora brassicae]SPQ94298.1 unnamed protein product [Plasmodiophora brassicae]